MKYYNNVENGIYDCISELIQLMNDADIMCINNEFTYSDRGPLKGKSFTFRAHPSRVNILKELGRCGKQPIIMFWIMVKML